MALSIDQYVLRLQIAVCDAFSFVQKFQDEDDFGSVELRGGLVEASGPAEIAEDLTARAIVKLHQLAGHDAIGMTGAYEHVQRVVVLEARDHCGYEGMSCHDGKHVTLVADVFDLLQLDDWWAVVSHGYRCTADSGIPSILRRILRAKTWFSSPFWAFFRRTSQTRAKVPVSWSVSHSGWSWTAECTHLCPAS